MNNKTEFRNFEHRAWQSVADKYEHQSRKSFFEAARILNKGGRFGFTVWEVSPGAKIIDEAINRYAKLNLTET